MPVLKGRSGEEMVLVPAGPFLMGRGRRPVEIDNPSPGLLGKLLAHDDSCADPDAEYPLLVCPAK